MPPRIVNLTIDHRSLDTNELLSEWRWLVPADYTPVQMNTFGDWFLTDSQEHVHMLDVMFGELRELAPSLPEYNQLNKIPDNQWEWFYDQLVFRCDEAGMILGSGQCYGWRKHHLLGGMPVFENIEVVSLHAYQSFMGQLSCQTRNLKPGDPIPSIRLDPA